MAHEKYLYTSSGVFSLQVVEPLPDNLIQPVYRWPVMSLQLDKPELL